MLHYNRTHTYPQVPTCNTQSNKYIFNLNHTYLIACIKYYPSNINTKIIDTLTWLMFRKNLILQI